MLITPGNVYFFSKKKTEICSLGSHWGRQQYESQTFSQWEQPLTELEEYLPKKDRSRFRRDRGRFFRFFERMQLNSPFHAQDIKGDAMERRFGLGGGKYGIGL